MISHKSVKDVFIMHGFVGSVSPRVTARINETLAAFAAASVRKCKPSDFLAKGGGAVLPMQYFGAQGSGYYDGTPQYTDMSATPSYVRPGLMSDGFGPYLGGGGAGLGATVDDISPLIKKSLDRAVTAAAQRANKNVDAKQRSRMLVQYTKLLCKAVERVAKKATLSVDLALFEDAIKTRPFAMLQ